MVKVGEAMSQSNSVAGLVGRDDKRISDLKADSFKTQLIKIEGDTQEERIKNLAQMVFDQGEKLGKKVDIRELRKYKELMSVFLEEAVGSSSKFSKESYLDRRGRYRVYATVKKINEEVDTLTKEVLNAEKDNIKVLEKLDDIRGLIMDIFM